MWKDAPSISHEAWYRVLGAREQRENATCSRRDVLGRLLGVIRRALGGPVMWKVAMGRL